MKLIKGLGAFPRIGQHGRSFGRQRPRFSVLAMVAPIALTLMPGAMTATAARHARREHPGKGEAPAAPAQIVPFARGAVEFAEGTFIDEQFTPGANGRSLGEFEVPARGWGTSIAVLIEATGGVLGPGSLHEDYPFNLVSEIELGRPNGDPYFGPMSGFSAFLSTLAGGYQFFNDPRADPEFVGTINASYFLRVPIEITHHDAFGALINQDAAAPYTLRLRVPASSDIFPVAPTTVPNVRVRAWLEGWTQPPAQDVSGRPIEQEPPGTPTAQFWNEQTFRINGGKNTLRLTDVGNLIRCVVLIYRTDDVPPVRNDSEFPQDSLVITYNARELEDRALRYWHKVMFERYGRQFPLGVVVYDKIHDGEGKAGDETRNQYLPTSDATRVEIRGVFGGSGGTLTVLTNSVAPAGVGRTS